LLAGGLGAVGIPVRAGQLTYLTALGLIPLLAVFYTVAQAAFGPARVHAQLDAFVSRQVSVGASQQFGDSVHQFLHKASELRGISLAFLFLSTLSLLFNTEAAFNAIFHAKSARRIGTRLAIYCALLISGPLLLALSLLATTS
jgi:membrane protein